MTKRKLDCLCEDDVYGGPPQIPLNGYVASPLRKRPYTPHSSHGSDHDYSSSQSSPAINRSTGKPKRSFCSQLCGLFKALCMMTSCVLLMAFAFFLWKTYRCESDRQLVYDIEGLRKSLKENLFGQNLARTEILEAMTRFVGPDGPAVSVLALTGWLGGGKTFTSSLIREHFPLPENLHTFSVPLHFAENTDNFHFLADLTQHIGRSCGHSLVVFDDVDSASSAAVERIERFIVSLKHTLPSPRGNGTLVVLTSNKGGEAINKYVFDLMREQAASRDRLTSETLLRVMEEEGIEVPAVRSSMRHGIPARIVPYLPLTRDHVKQCVRREISRQGFTVHEQDVNDVLREVRFFSDDFPVLAASGCKQISGKVDVLLGGQDPYLAG